MRKTVLTLLLIAAILYSAPVNEKEALDCARGWLNTTRMPMGEPISTNAAGVSAGNNSRFYIVSLEPSGFVILNSDDLLEPVIAFSATGSYCENPRSPLYALLCGHSDALHNNLPSAKEGSLPRTAPAPTAEQDKWASFQAAAEGYPALMDLSTISDVQVAPLIESKWGQEQVCSKNAYNLYTPSYYPCGCVATAMAQLMRFHQYPDFGIGVVSETIEVNANAQTAYTRGGDGSGGAYDWSVMDLEPDCSSSSAALAQIGALCYDAGVAVKMSYASDGSGAYTDDVIPALEDVFGYAQAGFIYGRALSAMQVAIDSNLNAGLPVLLGISSSQYGHEIVCDGYGYNSGVTYHHMNMGWDGAYDLWYVLPDIDIFNNLDEVVYNVFPDATGGIISGRVMTAAGLPVAGALISAGEFSAYSNEKGIYAITALPAGSYELTADDGSEIVYAYASVSASGSEWTNTSDTDFTMGLERFTVTFSAGAHGVITAGTASQLVYDGADAQAPVILADAGWYFTGWDSDYTAIAGDIIVTALYSDMDYAGDNFELRALSSYYNAGGDAGWQISQTAHAGSWSMRSGDISDEQTSSVEVTVPSATNVSFWKFVSTELDYDYLRFYIDGVEKGSWSGVDTSWSNVSFTVASGSPHVLKWSYTKDESVAGGENCAWIDDIVVVDDSREWTVTFLPGEHGSITSGETVQLVATGTSAAEPGVTADEGWYFVGWDSDFSVVSADMVITALYSDSVSDGYDFDNGIISPDLVMSGDADWFLSSSDAQDARYSLRSGVITDDESSTVSVYISGGEQVSFWRFVSSEANYDYLIFTIDGAEQGRWSGIDTSWIKQTYLLGSGTHLLSWTYTKDYSVSKGDDCAYIDDILILSTPSVYTGDDFESGYINSLYNNSGSSYWEITSTMSHGGLYSIQSGDISDSQSASIEVDVRGVEQVSFWKFVSSEERYDLLRFYIDGVLRDSWSGIDTDWSKALYPLDAYSGHTLKWTYIKDDSITEGLDCAFIDDIQVVISATASPDINADGTVDTQDLSLLCAQWLEEPVAETAADLNKDGAVDIEDFTILASEWFESF